MIKALTIGSLLAVTFLMGQVHAQSMPTDPIGGKPPAGLRASVADLDYQVKYQRAFEAVLWSMPAIEIYGFHRASELIGAGPNVILAMSGPAKPNMEGLTANNQTPYVASQTDLRKGPVVLEVPTVSEKASLYGQIVDHWQITIADVGPSGVDQGMGGKILLTPPGYAEPVPDDYIEIKSPSYRVAFAFRSVPGPESSQAQANLRGGGAPSESEVSMPAKGFWDGARRGFIGATGPILKCTVIPVPSNGPWPDMRFETKRSQMNPACDFLRYRRHRTFLLQREIRQL